MIDLHSHILPGLDDGAPDLETSLGMARTAAEDGISTIAATPHVNRRYPVRPDAIAREVGRLNVALARMALPLAVLPAAEVALNAIGDLDKTTLRQLTIGGSGCLLVEPPYADRAPFLERILFSLQVQGFRPMLAHPERALAFQDRPERLARVVEGGVLACVNAGSMIGRFGRGSQERALRFLADGLVAVVASDSHDGESRPPALRAAFEEADEYLPGVAQEREYFTETAPAALLAGGPVPKPPALSPPRHGLRWRRIFARRR